MNETVIEQRTTYFPVFRLRMAGYLMIKGFPIDHIDVNFDNPDWNVYYFRNTPRLRETIERYDQRRERHYGKYKEQSEETM